jgi:hypothetical protein
MRIREYIAILFILTVFNTVSDCIFNEPIERTIAWEGGMIQIMIAIIMWERLTKI